MIGNWKLEIGNSRKGFTLIELLVAFSIIGVLAASGFALLNPALQLKRARDATRKTDLGKMQVALELYRADVGSYPTATIFSSTAPVTPACGAAFTAGGITYFNSRPCDPKPTAVYVYTYTPTPAGTPTSYTLTACLEALNTNNTNPCPAGAVYTVTNQ